MSKSSDSTAREQALVTVVILTHNEEANLSHALESLRSLNAKIVIVDSGSTDRTVELARSFGCIVLQNPWVNYANQLNWALNHHVFDTPWTMRLDADERLTPELVVELKKKLPTLPPSVAGLFIKRRVYFWGRWIRHGGYYPTWLLRVWRSGKARCEERWMDEHMVLADGSTQNLEHDLIDENHKGLGFWTDKHNRYADREVKDLLALESQSGTSASANVEGQAGRKRWMKENLYARSPLFYRAMAYWAMRYFAQGGILDGKEGLVFHFLQGFWYRFLVDAKLYEHARAKGRS